ncbi:MAG: hypothetical protein Fur0035_01050 [Anaerolineales bacterium]
MKDDLLRARYVVMALLGLALTCFLTAALAWPFWLALAAGILAAAALEIWARFGAPREKAPENILHPQARAALLLQQKFIESYSERDILEAVLSIGSEVLAACGASFVPFDEYRQPLPALIQGEVPENAMQNWSSRLRAPETRTACKNCQVLHGGPGCVLIPLEIEQPSSVRCFPLKTAGREVGAVNYFFKKSGELPSPERIFIAEMLQVAGKALENLQARDQEMTALRYLQTASSPRSDLTLLLNSLLENVQRALDTDFALLYLPVGLQSGVAPAPLLLSALRSDSPLPVESPDQDFLEGLWQSVLKSGHSISLENVTLNQREMWKVLLALPLVWREESPAGVMVLGSNSSQTFAPRQRVLLETLTAQAALLIQNARLMVQVEYQAVVDERARLAREIHDGLAQTLAFLKIQSSQMQNYLVRGEVERLSSTLQANYRTLSDAYIDARQAIDNLRRVPGSSLRDWLATVTADFEQSAGISVELDDDCLGAFEFSANVQAQLIRIVQEAYSNIRKHARASHVWLTAHERNGIFTIEVRDNGCGFEPAQVESAARYGLRGMRERAEGIGADFQVISRPNEGTTLLLSLPLALKENV